MGEDLHGHEPPELGRGGGAGDPVEPDGLEEGDEPAGSRHVGVAGVERPDSVRSALIGGDGELKGDGEVVPGRAGGGFVHVLEAVTDPDVPASPVGEGRGHTVQPDEVEQSVSCGIVADRQHQHDQVPDRERGGITEGCCTGRPQRGPLVIDGELAGGGQPSLGDLVEHRQRDGHLGDRGDGHWLSRIEPELVTRVQIPGQEMTANAEPGPVACDRLRGGEQLGGAGDALVVHHQARAVSGLR